MPNLSFKKGVDSSYNYNAKSPKGNQTFNQNQNSIVNPILHYTYSPNNHYNGVLNLNKPEFSNKTIQESVNVKDLINQYQDMSR